jgi:ABC-2 type transport system permease protein
MQKRGINPINLTVNTEGKQEKLIVFPCASVRIGQSEKLINLIEMGGLATDDRKMEMINSSINLLEYKFANAIQKLQTKSRPRIALLSGHGELQRPYSEGLEKALFEYYDIARVDLDSTFGIDKFIDLLIIAKPQLPFGERHQFMIDQYIMNGGKTLWLVDMLNVELDSFGAAGGYVPYDKGLDIAAQLYSYGARINANLIADLRSSKIPVDVNTNPQGKPQLELKTWIYHPTVYPYHTAAETQKEGVSSIQHPIVKNLDYVDTRYPSSIDIVQTKSNVKATSLLRSSRYSKALYPPVQLSLSTAYENITQDMFEEAARKNANYLNIAVLLEGEFSSYFRNRVSPEMTAKFAQAGRIILEKGQNTKMVIVSDGDIAKNEVLVKNNTSVPLGLNKFEGYQYANRDFLINTIEYMLDEKGIIAARNKEIKIRPLDQERAFKEELMWQFLNLGLPLIIIAIFGGFYSYWRKKQYGS